MPSLSFLDSMFGNGIQYTIFPHPAFGLGTIQRQRPYPCPTRNLDAITLNLVLQEQRSKEQEKQEEGDHGQGH